MGPTIATSDSSIRRRAFEDVLVDRLRRPWPWFIAALVLVTTYAQPYGWRVEGDAVCYASMARSLAHTGQMTNLGREQLYYSPGYPVLLSPLFLFSDQPWPAMATVHWLLAAAILVCAFRWVRLYASTQTAVVISLGVVLNTNLLYYAHSPLSETAFTAILIATTLAMTAAMRAESSGKLAKWTILAALGAAALACVRHVGVMLAAGFALAMLLQAVRGHKRWGHAAASAASVLLIATAVVAVIIAIDYRHAGNGKSATYMRQMFDESTPLHARLGDGLHAEINGLGRLMVPGLFKTYAQRGDWTNPIAYVYLAVMLTLAWGWWRFTRSTADPLAMTVPLYLGVYLLWPYEQGARFYVPLLPAFWMALWYVVKGLPRHRLSLLSILLTTHALATLIRAGSLIPEWRNEQRSWPLLTHAALAIQDRSDPIAALNMPGAMRDKLAFLLDRPVIDYNHPSTSTPVPGWLVIKGDIPVPSGYIVARDLDELIVAERRLEHENQHPLPPRPPDELR